MAQSAMMITDRIRPKLQMMDISKRFGATVALQGVNFDVFPGEVHALVGENGAGSLAGGAGSILGSLVGAIIMTIIRVGSQLNGWPTWVTQVATGAIIVVAVAVDRIRHRQAE